MAYDDSSDGFGSSAAYDDGARSGDHGRPGSHGLQETHDLRRCHVSHEPHAAQGTHWAHGTPGGHIFPSPSGIPGGRDRPGTPGDPDRPSVPGDLGRAGGYAGSGPVHRSGAFPGATGAHDSAGRFREGAGSYDPAAPYESAASCDPAGSYDSTAPYDPLGPGGPGGSYGMGTLPAPGGGHAPDRGVGTDTGPGAPEGFPVALKVLVAGGFGVGKTTFVGAVSEIAPLSTEELLTQAGAATDNLDGVESKTSTTVAMDFGRITLDERHVLYLFGTPGQERFWFMWDELSQGALGAVVLADTRRLTECFAAVDFFERRGIGFIVAVNEFDGSHRYEAEEVRTALDLGPDVPVVRCDARIASSGTGALVTLVQHLINATAAVPDPLTAFGARS